MPSTSKKAAKKTRPTRRIAPAASVRGEETRARLLDAAYDEFRRSGYHGTSMRQIAQAAGMAVGGIYNHFHSKEDIFAAVLDSRHPYHAILPALKAAEGATLEAFVHDAGRRIQAATRGVEDQLLPLVFIELVEFQGKHLQDLIERFFPNIMGFAQTLAERPGPMRALPLPVVIRTLISLTIGYLMTDMFLKNSPVFKSVQIDWYPQMLDIFLHGILAAPAAEA
jgi:AcrR family transcriptional regulator